MPPLIPIRVFTADELGRIAAASIREFSSEVLHAAAIDVACMRMAEMSGYNVAAALSEDPGLGICSVGFDDIKASALTPEIRVVMRNPLSSERRVASMDFLAIQSNIGVLNLAMYEKLAAIGNDLVVAAVTIATLPEVRMKLIISPVNARPPLPMPVPS